MPGPYGRSNRQWDRDEPPSEEVARGRVANAMHKAGVNSPPRDPQRIPGLEGLGDREIRDILRENLRPYGLDTGNAQKEITKRVNEAQDRARARGASPRAVRKAGEKAARQAVDQAARKKGRR